MLLLCEAFASGESLMTFRLDLPANYIMAYVFEAALLTLKQSLNAHVVSVWP
jgi:hypothetical protein